MMASRFGAAQENHRPGISRLTRARRSSDVPVLSTGGFSDDAPEKISGAPKVVSLNSAVLAGSVISPVEKCPVKVNEATPVKYSSSSGAGSAVTTKLPVVDGRL